MSTLAITAAHFVAIPVCYAVGRWYNIPTNTLLTFNAGNFVPFILARSIVAYYEANKWKLTIYQRTAIQIVSVTSAILSAVYMTSKITNPMPIPIAYVLMTNVAAFTSIYALVALAQWIQGKNE